MLNLIIAVMAALTTGGAVLISQHLSSEQPEQAAFFAEQLARIFPLSSRRCTLSFGSMKLVPPFTVCWDASA